MDIIWSVGLSIVTLVIGVFAGAGFNEYRKRALLEYSGGGTGRTGGFVANRVTVRNPPSFLGLSIQPSTIFGRRIHPGFARGLWVDRHPATDCSAQLYEKGTGHHVAIVYWRSQDDPATYEQFATIAAGRSRTLMLFVRLSDEPDKYFVFAPDKSASHGIKVPEERMKFSGDRQFELRIHYSHGREAKVYFGVRLDYNGHLYVERMTQTGSVTGSGMF